MHIRSSLLISAIALLAVLLVACQKDIDGDSVPPSTGIDPREDFFGNWSVTDSVWLDSVLMETRNYDIEISDEGTSSDTLYISNLWNTGSTYYALLSDTSFVFPTQDVNPDAGTVMSGTGTFTPQFLSAFMDFTATVEPYVIVSRGLKQ